MTTADTTTGPGHGHHHHTHHVDLRAALAPENITLARGGALLWKTLVAAGVLLAGLTILGAFAGDKLAAKGALHALHTGFINAALFPVAALGVVMIFHAVNAGWSGSVRRVFEHMMSVMWVLPVLFVVVALTQVLLNAGGELTKGSPFLWNWMNPVYVIGDPLYEHKRSYLNGWFFTARTVLVFLVWIGLGLTLLGLSLKQDDDGDKWHTARMRRLSRAGLPFYAFATAFAGFDWMMALDFHWFSTMFGVYFFACGMVASLALGALVLVALRSVGKLHVAFTDEHLHDLSKLLFAFVVFWAYIAFSQYFLIWYANIPEETMFFQERKDGAWVGLSWFIPIAHFILPFVILLPKPLRRSRGLVAGMCVYLIVVTLIETFWMIRAEVPELAPGRWYDFTGTLGLPLVVIGLFVRRLRKGNLIPINDPRRDEFLGHKNHV